MPTIQYLPVGLCCMTRYRGYRISPLVTEDCMYRLLWKKLTTNGSQTSDVSSTECYIVFGTNVLVLVRASFQIYRN